MARKTTKEDRLAKGFKCRCGQEHVYPAYVFAHWNDPLQFKCPGCGRVYAVQHGKARIDRMVKS